jgi:uncharacterized protein (TIGR02246 family)
MLLCRLFVVSLLAVTAVSGLGQQSSIPLEAIARLRTDWSRDLHDKKLDQIVLLYAPDAVFLPPNGARITGRSEIRDLTRKAMDAFTSDLTFQSLNTGFSGDLAYDSGEYRETLTSATDGSISHGQGNYLMVFQRQKDGSWVILQQVWTALAFGQP